VNAIPLYHACYLVGEMWVGAHDLPTAYINVFRDNSRGIITKLSEIVRVDSRGRIIIPSSLRSGLGLSEGTYLMLVADLDKKEATLVPFAHAGAKLAEFQIGFGDSPGALAKAAASLAELGVDLLSSQSRTLRRGELAEWYVIGDVSTCRVGIVELQRTLEKERSIKSVRISLLAE